MNFLICLLFEAQQFDSISIPNLDFPMETSMFVNWSETHIFVERETGLAGHD